MVCRGLLLMLHRSGEIELPAVRQKPFDPFLRWQRPQPMLVDQTPLAGPLWQILLIEIQQVRRTAEEPLFNSLIDQHHFLEYEQPVGEHLKYLAWSSTPRHLGSREGYIGWSPEALRRNIRFLAYNTRFLIWPWVRIPHLASHILGRVALRLSEDWEQVYQHPVTFRKLSLIRVVFAGPTMRRTRTENSLSRSGSRLTSSIAGR